MVIVERHKIETTQQIIDLCGYSKELYNYCLFHMRQAYFFGYPLYNISELIKIVKNTNCYNNLHNTKTAAQTIRKLLSDWSNFKLALKAYYKEPGKFTGKPRPPYYKKKLAQVIFYNETIQRKPRKLGIITPTNGCFSVKSNVIGKFRQAVITPKHFGFIVEISYDIEEAKSDVSKEHICCIDLGVNNLGAIISDQHGPTLINGRILKSINQWYNKRVCKRRLEKRYFRLENYFHHASKFIIDECIKHQIGKIIIGKNKGWKVRIKMKDDNKQNFFYIPYENFINKVTYKGKLVGIEVEITEEAYTSKASFLDRDELPEYGQPKPVWSGTRVHRGLYKSSSGRIINADVNGSANIGRKVIRNIDVVNRLDRSLTARPVRTNPLKAFV